MWWEGVLSFWGPLGVLGLGQGGGRAERREVTLGAGRRTALLVEP